MTVYSLSLDKIRSRQKTEESGTQAAKDLERALREIERLSSIVAVLEEVAQAAEEWNSAVDLGYFHFSSPESAREKLKRALKNLHSVRD
jgi:hypothetical protein